MRKFFSAIRAFILPILVILVIFSLGFTIVGGIAIGLGHLLMRIFPLSLFEATVLSTTFTLITIYLITFVVSLFSPSSFSRQLMEYQDEDEEWQSAFIQIPTSRFYASEDGRTWEAWLRAEIANDIYMEFQNEENRVVNLNDTQMQELAIRLSDLAISILKRKRGGRGRLTINMSSLRRELSRMGQRAYDDRIMRLALGAINMNLDHYSVELMRVIHAQAWDELADTPEW